MAGTTYADKGVFEVKALSHDAGLITASLIINQNSHIFAGHFPGQPVVPGACMLQLVKDVLEEILNGSVLLKKAANIKFINRLTPDDHTNAVLTISYKITGDGINANAQISTDGLTCFKLQALYINL